jgi:pyruvate decarboxylase
MIKVGDYISTRLVTFGVECVFGVVGDTSSALLNSVESFEPSLKLVTCCSDASAGYAADGYARKSGKLGAVMVPYLTGSLSIANAVAGAYAGNVPMLIICGGPNSTAAGNNKLMHHTINSNGFSAGTSAQCLSGITAKAFVVHHADSVAGSVDKAMYTALKLRKPVYLEIACDLMDKFIAKPVAVNLVSYSHLHCDELSLEVALCDSVRAIQYANVPVVVVGSEVKSLGANTHRHLARFCEKLQAAVVVQPDAKGCFDEKSPLFAGSVWGDLSSPHVQQVLGAADLFIFLGVVLSDASTAGFSPPSLCAGGPLLRIHMNSLTINAAGRGAGFSAICRTFSYVSMDRLLVGLAERVPHKEASSLLLRQLQREAIASGNSLSLSHGAESVHPTSLLASSATAAQAILQSNNALSQACGSVCAALPPMLQVSAGIAPQQPKLHLPDVGAGIQRLLDSVEVESVVVAQGESWFLGQKLNLPKNCSYFMQLQYAASDWALGATLGASLAGCHCCCLNSSEPCAKPTVLIIGDGSFQSAVQELSTMIRLNLKVVVFLLNNQEEAIEGGQHPYTRVANWNYADLVAALQCAAGDEGSSRSSTDGADHAIQQLLKGGSSVDAHFKSIGVRVHSPAELQAAIKGLKPQHSVYLIECALVPGEVSSDCAAYVQQIGISNRTDYGA